MITMFTGLPGSGKTYYSVNNILNIITKEQDKFQHIYTNINGFDFNFDPITQKLKIDLFDAFLKSLYKLYIDNQHSDDVDELLINKCKKDNYYSCYFIIDEAHNYLQDNAFHKVWWFTYHRHLFHEIDIITQNKSLINTKYRGIIETFIHAIPVSKKISANTLTYNHFADFKMRAIDKFNKSSLRKQKEVFALYKSGNMSNQKSIVIKFILSLSASVLFVALVFYIIMNRFSPDVEETKNEKSKIINNKTVSNSPISKIRRLKKSNVYIPSLNNNLTVEITCDTFEGCYIKNKLYPERYFNAFIRKTRSELLLKTILFKDETTLYYRLLLSVNTNLFDKYFIADNSNNIKSNKTQFKPNSSVPPTFSNPFNILPP